MKRATILTRAMLTTALTLAYAGLVQADEAEAYGEIRQKLASQDLAAAEELHAKALEDYPDSEQLKSLHALFASYLQRDGRHLDAARHAEANVDHLMGQLGNAPALLSNFGMIVQQMTDAYLAGGEGDAAVEKLDGVIGRVQALEGELEKAQIAGLVGDLQGKKAVLLFRSGKQDEANTLLTEVHDRLKAAFEANPDDAGVVVGLANILSARAEITEGTEDAEAAKSAHREFLAEQAKKHGDSLQLVAAYVSTEISAIGNGYREDAAKAEGELLSLEETLAGLESEDPNVARLVASAERSMASLKRAIEAAKIQQELIGKPAFPLDAHAWVHGDPLTDEDLEGKVVLIDFWAVWCGPCIATFPHLIEWHDKYADQGFVIIGATRHYQYGWDEEANSITRDPEISPEDEEAALIPFAEHHGLKHRFMVMPDGSDFSQKYGVTGIPTAVLIDRAGTIQMIRVGSGPANAHALQEKIEELLQEPAAGG